ncbi:MAG: DUF3291 domain-containing protein [Hyphomonadaceae bacterium]
MHIAELNIARLKHPMDDPRTADFANNLDLINELAERTPGFVWRLKDEAGNATSFRISDDPLMIANLSVWESAEALEHFVFNTLHRRFYARREEWFEVMQEGYFVMWRIERGEMPTLEEAMARLAKLRAEGASEEAFDWEHLIGPERLKAQRCAARAA